MNKVDKVIHEYLEAAGLNLEDVELTPDEQKALSNVQKFGAKTKGGKKLADTVQKKTVKQDKDANTAAMKLNQT